jgi:solute carrier family 25 S-adenosylmethionine transporter 26
VACSVRVPTEVLKQRLQTGMDTSLPHLVRQIYNEEKQGFKGFYKGFGITILREVPFSLIQFPIYEKFKVFFFFGIDIVYVYHISSCCYVAKK